ncbi:CLUMA_CG017754, isoform A [Clunio marinus]|uniref:Glucosidase II subunit alpha n=1 Tax=Clunio marinus TaxID=568069 RepID=A0A1J1IYB0_9DIPT|nr:CLUMA_CG017754, isoform A [Clunio marinus]
MKTILILIVGICFVSGADRSLFKTCGQSSFCRRCRNVSGPSNYVFVQGTLAVDKNSATVEIQNTQNFHIFTLKISGLMDNTFRVEMDEKSPLSPRFRVTEALQQEPILENIDVTISDSEIIIRSKMNRAVITKSPLKIDFYRNDVHALTFNGNGLLRFEELRTKPAVLDPSEDPDSWEETFMDEVDSKPRGPEAVAVDFYFPESEVLFGIPEHCDSFALRTTLGDEPYRLYTLDVTGYEIDSRMPIYGAIPVLYGHGAGQTTGVFWHNSADTFVDVHDKKTVHFISETGIIDVFVLLGPSPKETFIQYTKLTGVTNLPQLHNLAYHQSRWNYMTQQEVIEVVDNFDLVDIPLDTVWLDIEYTNGKRYFTWDKSTFPQPLEMMQNLTDLGRYLTFIIDPHVFVDEDYSFYAQNRARGYYIKNSDGSDYQGVCWPGMSSYVDYFNPEARRFYADQYLLENFAENSVTTGIWNDMNEPTVFDVPEKTIPRDAVHFNGWEHRNLHSLYAHMQTKGTYDGMMRRSNGELRPFILTRAFFSGTQRYSAVWTGDNTDTWEYLEASIKMCLSISVAGISFCGSDVGGFFGDPEEELFVRWYQAAAFQPFFRSHANFDSPRREPYLLEGDSLAAVRDAIKIRYAMLPFWYTMFYEHERFGHPVMTPMLTNYPHDTRVFNLDNQYMLSDVLLVRPVTSKNATEVEVRFPPVDGITELWYDVTNYNKIENMAGGTNFYEVDRFKYPVFQRGGTIMPRKETERKSSMLMVDDPISLFVALDRNNEATGTLYIDDEKSFNYHHGEYLYLRFTFSDNSLSSHHIDDHAHFESSNKLARVCIADLNPRPLSATYTNARNETRELDVSYPDDVLYLVIETTDISLNDEWTIKLNYESGAKQNIICGGLLIFVLVLQFGKHLLN